MCNGSSFGSGRKVRADLSFAWMQKREPEKLAGLPGVADRVNIRRIWFNLIYI